MPSSSQPKDFLWLQLQDLPYFRAVLRAVESRFYQDIPLPQPVLDLGCGDGHFVTITFDKPIDFGIDPWTGPVKQAAQRGGYRIVVQGAGGEIPVPDGTFASVMSNSVLEHIPELDPVLAEVARVIQPGGLFVFCVPNHNFLDNLSVSSFFDKIGLHFLGNAYRTFFNRISRHYHCDSPQVWQDRLARAGFRIERWWHYFSPKSLHILEWGHYLGLPSLVSHVLFRRWILLRQPWNLVLAKAICQPAYDEPDSQPKGSYTFFIARRMGGQ
ncbi:MAG TPA: class I SAM-dependent methyltransferase [Longilinea sp.]|nr:class I SAM-dependent methyltransferase [Longilinea sp.]